MLVARTLLFLCSLAIMAIGPAVAQDMLLVGRVQARSTHQPLPYVNIGVRGENVGTVADAQGSFSLRIPAALASDTLTFSAIGYHEQALALAHLAPAELQPVLLAEKTTELAEVLVRGRAEKVRQLGTTTHNPLLWGSIANKETHDINEFAKLISLGDVPTQVVQAHIFLRRPTVDTVSLRLNLYHVAQGLPGRRIVEQPILVRTAIRNGWLTIDLTKYALTLQADFFLSFEFLPQKQGVGPAFSYGAQFGGAAMVRTSSLGRSW